MAAPAAYLHPPPAVASAACAAGVQCTFTAYTGIHDRLPLRRAPTHRAPTLILREAPLHSVLLHQIQHNVCSCSGTNAIPSSVQQYGPPAQAASQDSVH